MLTLSKNMIINSMKDADRGLKPLTPHPLHTMRQFQLKHESYVCKKNVIKLRIFKLNKIIRALDNSATLVSEPQMSHEALWAYL